MMICLLYIVSMYCGDIFYLIIIIILLSDLFMLVIFNYEDLLKIKIFIFVKDFFYYFEIIKSNKIS